MILTSIAYKIVLPFDCYLCILLRISAFQKLHCRPVSNVRNSFFSNAIYIFYCGANMWDKFRPFRWAHSHRRREVDWGILLARDVQSRHKTPNEILSAEVSSFVQDKC